MDQSCPRNSRDDRINASGATVRSRDNVARRPHPEAVLLRGAGALWRQRVAATQALRFESLEEKTTVEGWDVSEPACQTEVKTLICLENGGGKSKGRVAAFPDSHST